MSNTSRPSTPRSPTLSYAPFEPISEEHICPVTKGLLVDPYQSSCCGNYFSKEAVDGLLAQNALCPMCRVPLFRCTPDKAFKRRVHQALKVRCLLHDGCNWSGIYSDFLQHCGIRFNDTHQVKGVTTPIVNKNVIEFSMDNFNSHLNEKTYYISPSFYTHQKGYKMCIRVYPNGYDACEGTHLCAVTFLMIGDHDDELQFPFRGSITLQILNQISNGKEGNYERIFEYNDKTEDIMCKRVPESEEMNSGLAIYNFIPLSELQNAKYIKEDYLKFRVTKIVVRSCSKEQLQYEDVKSSTTPELNCEPKWMSKNSMEIDENIKQSNEQILKIESDDYESCRTRPIMKRQHSIGSSSSVESSCSHPTDSRRENVPKYNETSQLTNDGWEIWSTNRKRDSYKKSKLPADDALRSDARKMSSARTNSDDVLVEADGDSSVFESYESDRNDTESSELAQDIKEIQQSHGPAQQSLRRTYSEGANNRHQREQEKKKHHSCDGALSCCRTEYTGDYADERLNGNREEQSKEGSRFVVCTLLGSTLTIMLALLITALLQKWQLPFQNLAPRIIATSSAVSPSIYTTLKLTSSSSNTDNDTQAIELKMKNLANMVAFKVSSKWRLIGVQLELPTYVLNDIQSQVAREPDSNMHAFELILEKWKTLQTSPYTWHTLIEALESPAVGEMEVAADLRKKGIT